MEDLKCGMDPKKARVLQESAGANHMIMVDGGTGVGKASSILTFAAATGEFVIWTTLGSASLHTEKFWRAFSTALKRWSNHFVTADQAAIPTELKDVSKFTAEINQAAARTAKAIVVFENYHLLADGPIKNLIENIKISCAVGVSTVLVCDDTIEISSISSLTTSRQSDQIFAFTLEEIRVYYTALNIVIDKQILKEFYEITGGWVQAILRIGTYLPRGEAIHREHMDHAIHLLYQHFHEEHHAAMQPELRQSLILLSMLKGFTLEMVLALTPVTIDDCAKLYLNHRFCYSASVNLTGFHKLYQRYLDGVQNEVPKKTQFAFLRKAAAWYEQHNLLIEAMECYTRCKEYDAIIPVLQKRAIPGYTPVQAAQIVACLETIPKSYMDKHPLHRLYLILSKYYTGEKELALRMQRQLHAELDNKKRDAVEDKVLGELHVSQAYQAWSDIGIAYYQHMKAASELLPEGSAFLDVDEYHSLAGSVLHFHQLMPGDLLQAKEICLKSAPYTMQVLPNIGCGACYLAVAEVHLYRCEYDAAIEYANLAAAEGARTKMWGVIAESCYILQRIHMAIGELDDILVYGQEVIDYHNLLHNHHTSLYSIERITKFHENVYFGLYHLLDSFSETSPVVNQNDVNYINLGRELYIHAIYQVYALRRYHLALTFLDEAHQVSRTTGMFFARLKLLILKALVYAKMDMPAAAAKSFLEAYRISQSNEILFSFIEFGDEMLYLLDAIEPQIDAGELPEKWRARVLQEAERYQQQRTLNTLEYLRKNPHIQQDKLIQLTKQEYNALKYASMGKSTSETAQILRVNPSTVYLYLSRAYKKLGVGRKEQAVRIALAEGILD